MDSIHDLIGITARELWVNDVLHRKERLHLDDAVICAERNGVKRNEEFENRLLLAQRPVSFNCLYILVNGLIDLSAVTKIPISSADNRKIIAFLTFYQDLTPQLPLGRLFGLYQISFPNSKQKAIQHLLRHLRLESYFNPLGPPTSKEMQILLAMCEASQCKVLAQQFEVSVPTMSNHITHIREKIIPPFTLRHVLSKLRAWGKYSILNI